MPIIGRVHSPAQQGSVLNPFKDAVIALLNLLTDTSDTDWNGSTPSNSTIEAAADIINGEII